MTLQQNHNLLIDRYISQTILSLTLLYEAKLYGQFLIVFYASIDAMGLLGAAPDVEKAKSHTFKNWVNKFYLPHGSFSFNADDMWGARCGVLHTHTTSSDKSKIGEIKEILYINNQRSIPEHHQSIQTILGIAHDKYIVGHLQEMLCAFTGAVADFGDQLIKNCEKDQRYADRLRAVLTTHQMTF